MIIRPATLADLNECLVLDHATATDHVWQMKLDETESRVAVAFDTVRLPRQMRAEYPRDLEQLMEHWQLDQGFLAAEVDGELRGYMDLIMLPWQRTGLIANMAVERDYRRRGVGTALMREARQWARKQGLRTIQAEATTKNYPALCFYQKLGFQFCGYNDSYFANQDIALFFALALR
jgi:ribosomal protein S18 acetylase RimI-like enzyme